MEVEQQTALESIAKQGVPIILFYIFTWKLIKNKVPNQSTISSQKQNTIKFSC